MLEETITFVVLPGAAEIAMRLRRVEGGAEDVMDE